MRQLIFIMVVALSIVGCEPSEKRMPDVKLLLLDSVATLSTGEIPSGNPVVLMFISPSCEHCQKETEKLLTKMQELNNVKFFFISIEPLHELAVFNKYYHLSRYSNIVIGKDLALSMVKHFEIQSPPFTAVFNKDKELFAVFNGEFDINKLVEMIHKAS